MQWFYENWSTLIEIVALIYMALSLVVGLTPSPKDDALLKRLRKILIRVSILKPSDVPGTVKLPGGK